MRSLWPAPYTGAGFSVWRLLRRSGPTRSAGASGNPGSAREHVPPLGQYPRESLAATSAVRRSDPAGSVSYLLDMYNLRMTALARTATVRWRRHYRALPVCIAAAVLLGGCRSRDVQQDLRMTEVKTGWYDAG